ncbi:hypothetical protein T439DRAFT_170036 [Meredithblackwellia eburnea MCA 4105]
MEGGQEEEMNYIPVYHLLTTFSQLTRLSWTDHSAPPVDLFPIVSLACPSLLSLSVSLSHQGASAGDRLDYPSLPRLQLSHLATLSISHLSHTGLSNVLAVLPNLPALATLRLVKTFFVDDAFWESFNEVCKALGGFVKCVDIRDMGGTRWSERGFTHLVQTGVKDLRLVAVEGTSVPLILERVDTSFFLRSLSLFFNALRAPFFFGLRCGTATSSQCTFFFFFLSHIPCFSFLF